MNLSKDFLEKAKSVKSVDELITLAKQFALELTRSQAGEIFEKIKAGMPDAFDSLLEGKTSGFLATLKEKFPFLKKLF